jgi:peptidoglycan hydrolase CwlO-like protein
MPDETQSILISLAKLETKLETKLDSISDTLKQIPELERRLREVEKYESEIKNNKDEINRLRATITIWNAANTLIILAAIVALFGFGLGGK